MGKRFAIVIGVAAAGVMALGAQPAAALPKYDTKVKITADGGGRGSLYHGWVMSEVRKCKVGRRVVLFRQDPGADTRLGVSRSVIGEAGGIKGASWGWLRGPENRRVYAKAMPKRREGFVCRADRSPIYGGDGQIYFRVGPKSATALTTAAEAKTFEYASKFSGVSTANGYPSPGGTAVLEGRCGYQDDPCSGFSRIKPGGRGFLTDHLTITEQLAPNRFAFKGEGVDDFGSGEGNSGELLHQFRGTGTVRADGSQRLAIEGHFIGGHVDIRPYVAGGSYRQPRGHYKGSATVAAGSTVIVGDCKGELHMH